MCHPLEIRGGFPLPHSVKIRPGPLYSLDLARSGVYVLKCIEKQLGKPSLDAAYQPLQPIDGIFQRRPTVTLGRVLQSWRLGQ
jgi:hypothetical protein